MANPAGLPSISAIIASASFRTKRTSNISSSVATTSFIFFSYIASLAVERKCCRLEWSVLHWNEPSINFYKKLGARPKKEWVIYNISGRALEKAAGIYKSK